MRYILTGILLVCFYSLHSQQFTTTVSEKLDYHGPLEIVSIGNEHIMMDADGYSQLFYTYTLNKARHRIALIKNDAKMKLVKKTKLSDGDRVYGPFPPVLKKINNTVRLFYYQLSEEKGTIDIFHSIVNTERLDISPPQKVLSFEQKNLGYFKTSKLFADYRFVIEQSPDRSKTLLLWCSGRNNNVFYSVLDSTMAILKSKSESITDADKFILHNACIDNRGTVYAGFNSGKILISPLNAATQTLTVKLANTQPEQVFVSTSRDKDVVYVAGISGEGHEKQAGAFSQNLDPTNFKLSPPGQTIFPAEIKEKIYQQLKRDRHTDKTTFSEIIFEPLITGSGQLHLVGKAKNTMDFQMVKGGSIRTVEFGSFVYVHIGTNTTKFTIFPKGTHNDDYFYCPFKDKMLFFWQDFDENLNRDIDEFGKVKNPNVVTFVAIISGDGTIKKQIASTENGLVSFSQLLNPGLLLIPSPTTTLHNGERTFLEIYKKSDFYFKIIEIKDAP